MDKKPANRIARLMNVMNAIETHAKELSEMGKADAYHCIREWSGEHEITDNAIKDALQAQGVQLCRRPGPAKGPRRTPASKLAQVLQATIDKIEKEFGVACLDSESRSELNRIVEMKK